LTAALARVAADPHLRGALGARARETARSFTWERSARQALGAYEVARHPPRKTRRKAPDVLHRPQLGWRGHRVCGAAGLRPGTAEHSRAEAQLLVKYGAGAHRVVEIGVAEGGSAFELAQVAARGASVHLIDPYLKGRLGISFMRVTAHRLMRKA